MCPVYEQDLSTWKGAGLVIQWVKVLLVTYIGHRFEALLLYFRSSALLIYPGRQCKMFRVCGPVVQVEDPDGIPRSWILALS